MKTIHPTLRKVAATQRLDFILGILVAAAWLSVLSGAMDMPPTFLASKDKLIVTGLFLSKFDKDGLEALGFESFIEAFNVIGFALGGRPASIKNYRDEFDPLHSNPRRGWHKRPRREHCMAIKEAFDHLDLPAFAKLIRSLTGSFHEETVGGAEDSNTGRSTNTFAERLITGLAAEHYFQTQQPKINDFCFSSCVLEDTTKLGCGYDYRLWPKESGDFLAVEVKGIKDRSGSLALTEREHCSAVELSGRYFLFVVKNFRESPYHEIHQNPLMGPLSFFRKERVVIQVSWVAAA